jgi:hypothetical protein
LAKKTEGRKSRDTVPLKTGGFLDINFPNHDECYFVF